MSIKNVKVERFIQENNTDLAGLRSIILFGKNTTSYKFALTNALMAAELKKSEIHYDDILPFFMQSFIEHFKVAQKQGTNKTSAIFRACQEHLNGDIDFQKLPEKCRPDVHKNVFKAFHNIGNGQILEEYSLFEWDIRTKVLTLKDPLLLIKDNDNYRQLISDENESRWQIVEEAWGIGVSPAMIYYDENSEQLIQNNDSLRKGLRSAVDALTPYQDGKCFYCKKKLNKFGLSTDHDYPEVDHVLPLARLRDLGFSEGNINGLWNLVLACRECNGSGEKGSNIPHQDHFSDLVKRNEYLLEEYGHIFKTGLLLSLDLKIDEKKLLANKMKEIYSNFQMIRKWKATSISE